MEGLGGPKYEHLGEVHLNHSELGVFVADCDAQGRPVFISEEIDRLVERTDADRVQLGHLTGGTWGMALEQLGAAKKGIVIPSDAPPGSAPLQAVALNQLAAGPSRWMPPTPPDRPGRQRPQIGRGRLSDPAGDRLLLRRNVPSNPSR